MANQLLQNLIKAAHAARLDGSRENTDALLDAIGSALGCTTVEEMECSRYAWDPRNRMVCIGLSELESLLAAISTKEV